MIFSSNQKYEMSNIAHSIIWHSHLLSYHLNFACLQIKLLKETVVVVVYDVRVCRVNLDNMASIHMPWAELFWFMIKFAFLLRVKDQVAPLQALLIKNFDTASVWHQQECLLLVEFHACPHDPRHYARVKPFTEQLNGEHLLASHPFEDSLDAHASPNCQIQVYLLRRPSAHFLFRLQFYQHLLHHIFRELDLWPLPLHLGLPLEDTLLNRLSTEHFYALRNLFRVGWEAHWA